MHTFLDSKSSFRHQDKVSYTMDIRVTPSMADSPSMRAMCEGTSEFRRISKRADNMVTKKWQAKPGHEGESSTSKTVSVPHQPRSSSEIVEDAYPTIGENLRLDVSTFAQEFGPCATNRSLHLSHSPRSRSRLVERIRKGLFHSSKDPWYQRNTSDQDPQTKRSEYVMQMVFFDRLEPNLEPQAAQFSQVAPRRAKSSSTQRMNAGPELVASDLLQLEHPTSPLALKSDQVPVVRAESPLSMLYARTNPSSFAKAAQTSGTKSAREQDQPLRIENPELLETRHVGPPSPCVIGKVPKASAEPASPPTSTEFSSCENKQTLNQNSELAQGSNIVQLSAPALAGKVNSASSRTHSTKDKKTMGHQFRSYNSISGRLCSQYDEAKSEYDSRHDRQMMHAQITVEVAPNVFMDLRSAMETLRAVQSGCAVSVTCVECQGTLKCVPDAELVMCPDCRVTTPMVLDQDAISGCTVRRGVGLGLKLPKAFRAAPVASS